MSEPSSVVPRLVLAAVDGPGRRFDLVRDVTTLGRHPRCDVVLGPLEVSRWHAEVRRDRDGHTLLHLSKTNVTEHNGHMLNGSVRLRDGDQIRICDNLLIFHHPRVVLDDDEKSGTILGSIPAGGSTDSGSSMRLRAEEKLPAILEISREIGARLELHEVLDRTLGSLFKIFPQADRGFVLLKGGAGLDLAPQAVRHRREGAVGLTLSKTILDKVMNDGEAILSTNLDPLFRESKSLEGSEIRTIMCVPLTGQDRSPIGILQIDTRHPKFRFNQDDLDLLAAVAGPISMAVENARLHQRLIGLTVVAEGLRHAREVQLALLPAHQPDPKGYEFWDAYEPAEQVGGDYFDYLPIHLGGEALGPNHRRWALTIGDVSGKGMPAALLMAKLVSEVRLFLLMEPEPTKVVERLNHHFAGDGFAERFVTFLLLVLDAESHEFSVVNAGHMPPILRRADGTVEAMDGESAGLPLAVMDEGSFSVVSGRLGPGDVVVLYTDGVQEAMSPAGRCLGMEALKAAVAGASGQPSAVGEAILKSIRDHAAGAPQSDDITVLCFGRHDPDADPLPHATAERDMTAERDRPGLLSK